jgi:hypothetical protein
MNKLQKFVKSSKKHAIELEIRREFAKLGKETIEAILSGLFISGVNAVVLMFFLKGPDKYVTILDFVFVFVMFCNFTLQQESNSKAYYCVYSRVLAIMYCCVKLLFYFRYMIHNEDDERTGYLLTLQTVVICVITVYICTFRWFVYIRGLREITAKVKADIHEREEMEEEMRRDEEEVIDQIPKEIEFGNRTFEWNKCEAMVGNENVKRLGGRL